MTKVIPVSKPAIGVSDVLRVLKTLGRGEISGLVGNEISKFENRFADFVGTEHAIACSSGTAALHLSLAGLGLGKGDEVLVSDTTNMASFFAVLYTGATPVPVDIDGSSLTMNPDDLSQKVTTNTRAIMPVHLFGQPCNMSAIVQVAQKHKLHIIEDCAEAHGASFGGKKVGSFGLAGCFSFFANKIVTTGEGGMVTTNDSSFAAELRALRSLNFGTGEQRFQHLGIGYNYRMTNLQASIGLAQMQKVEWLIESRRQVESTYKEVLEGTSITWQEPVSLEAEPVTWMSHFAAPSQNRRNFLASSLATLGIQTRPGFVPYSLQDESWRPSATQGNSTAVDFAHRTMYLPTWSGMPQKKAKWIADSVLKILE